MQRTRLRTALLFVVAAALGGIGYLVSLNVWARRVDPQWELGRDFLPQVAQRIQDFRRVKVEKGRTVWEITAKDAQYFDQTSQVVVHAPRMTFFLDDGKRTAHVEGDEGRLALDGQEVQSLTLRGNVAVTLDDMHFETDEATYVRARDVITTSASVTMRSPTLEVRGRGMEIEVGPQHVRLLEDVQTTLQGDGARS